jgi:hypothetical protein
MSGNNSRKINKHGYRKNPSNLPSTRGIPAALPHQQQKYGPENSVNRLSTKTTNQKINK